MRARLLAATLAGIIVVGAGALARQQQPPPRVIHITAERFSFSPSEIKVRAGEEVELRIQSEDTSHGFHVIDTDINAVVPKRGKGEVSVLFRSEGAGRYTFECSRMCGAGHDFMRGVLVVSDPAEAAQR